MPLSNGSFMVAKKEADPAERKFYSGRNNNQTVSR
jgi:hypothetical protein